MCTVSPKEYYCWTQMPLHMEKHIVNRIWLGTAHVFGLYGIYMILTGEAPITIVPFDIFYGYFAGLGITIGCHRLWAHRTFKAKLPLRILLTWMQTTSAQYPIFTWCRDHRIHHKYTETDADPHNARRGFWFSHIGWLLTKEHPAVKEKQHTIDFSDLDNDPIIRFQSKYYWYLYAVCVLALPMYAAHLLAPDLSILKLFSLNYVWFLYHIHFTYLVNSAAHLYGKKPYDKRIFPVENQIVSILALGEGWHNYHHTFPWDYKAAELGFYKYNLSTMIIDFFAWIGWAYDLKSVPENIVRHRVKRTGDGSHKHFIGNKPINNIEIEDTQTILHPWGWDHQTTPKDQYVITRMLKT